MNNVFYTEGNWGILTLQAHTDNKEDLNPIVSWPFG